MFTLSRRLASEFLGTALLLMGVVGSGIMGDNLSPDDGVALLANMAATGAILVVLILTLGPVSGAHFNPAVTVVFLMRKNIGFGIAAAYIGVQLVGGILGVVSAHFMFETELLQSSQKIRSGPSQWYSEFIATFGLVLVILGCVKFRESAVPFAVGLYISSAYWFTSSTSFANPAVTIARSFTDTFSGILPNHVPAFIAA
ncbi:MAG: MIP/aquaporin family protein, partial [Rhodospirillaceae bacterium]